MDLEPPPELADVFAGDEVKINMVHTKNKNFAELQQRHRRGCELLSAQKNKGRQELSRATHTLPTGTQFGCVRTSFLLHLV